uniref:KID domain-containing protein n=1 Tax=Electrophorus electricus TaxID=8005 RepID=A0A4W4F8P8_ELEEL
METVTATQQWQEDSVAETGTQIQTDSDVEVATLPGGQMLQEQRVIQTTQPSVIQSLQIQTIQVTHTHTVRQADVSDTQKRRELLFRRPSYRKILNELSSDTPAVPKIEEEEKLEGDTLPSSSVSTVTVPSSIYQTSLGQYIAITQGGAIQIRGAAADSLQGIQALTLPSPAVPQPGASILQHTPQAGDPAQQLLLSAGQVLVQGKIFRFCLFVVCLS